MQTTVHSTTPEDRHKHNVRYWTLTQGSNLLFTDASSFLVSLHDNRRFLYIGDKMKVILKNASMKVLTEALEVWMSEEVLSSGDVCLSFV